MIKDSFADDFDEWDCLYCKRVTSCPYGQAVVEQHQFLRLTESCPVRIEREWYDSTPPEVKEALARHYGDDPMAVTHEFEAFATIHRS